jgi:hypothetical protein
METQKQVQSTGNRCSQRKRIQTQSSPDDADKQSEKSGDESYPEDSCADSDSVEEGGGDDKSDDEEADEDDDKKLHTQTKLKRRGQCEWSKLALFDRTAMLGSEIEAVILAIIAAAILASGHKKAISLWVQNGEFWKTQGNTHVEKYYCPLRNRCDCRVQLSNRYDCRVQPALIALDWSGDPNAFGLYYSEEHSCTVK